MISVIVPVYNVENYVKKCLQSISEQTLKDIEVIIVNDGSTDNSGEICKCFLKNNINFKYYEKENGGLMSAWMYGVEKATGDYIGFVDSDDYINKTMYEKMYSKAKEYDVDIVMCNHYYEDAEDKTKLVEHKNPIEEGYYANEKLEKLKLKVLPKFNVDYISPTRVTKLIKKKLLLKNLLFLMILML